MASKTVTLKNNNGDQIHPKTKANAVFLEDGQNVENKFKTIVANDINYNPENSGMQVNNVQDAIDELFTSASNGKQIIADAITGKGVSTSADDTYATMAGNIEKIEAGVDISDTTLTLPEEMKEGVIAYNKTGDKIIGSLKEIQLLQPLISLNTSDGVITSTSIISSKGIINKSTTTKTYQLTTQSGTTITPGASQKIAVAAGKYTTEPIYVAGDSDLVPSNIKNGVDIFGVSGTYTGEYARGYITSVSWMASNKLRFHTNITLKNNILGSVFVNDFIGTNNNYYMIFNKSDFVQSNVQDQFGSFIRFPTSSTITYGIGLKNVDIFSTYFDITFTNPSNIYFSNSIKINPDSMEMKDGHNGRVIITYD